MPNIDNSINVSEPVDGPFIEEVQETRARDKPHVYSYCKFCLLRYRKKGHLKVHESTHTHINNQFICRACHYSYPSRDMLDDHNNKKHSHLYYICGHVFFSRRNLMEHKRSIHNINSPLKVFTCSFPSCSKTYNRKLHLESHINSKHTGEKPYSCKTCFKAFATKLGMKDHEKTCKNSMNKDNTLDCTECGQSFKYRGSLK